MLTLPAEVLQVFDPSTLVEPYVAARSLFDLEGNLGETHVIADRHTFHLLSRSLGGAFVKTSSPLDRIERLDLRTDGMYQVLSFRLGGQDRAVRFTTWDQPTLEQLVALWREVDPDGGHPSVTPPETVPTTPTEIRIPVAPRVLLAASLEAMAQADGDVGEAERSAIRRVLGASPAQAQGIEYLGKHGLESVLSILAAGLNVAQERCLLANLLGVAMSDGWLRSKEQEMLERFEEAIALSPGENQAIRDALSALFNIAVFAGDGWVARGPGVLAPIEVFCASLFLMAQEDGSVTGEELEALERLFPDSEQWTRASETSATRGVEGLLTDVGSLTRAQQRCLLANLLAVAMSDGWLQGAEQVEIERFRQAMSISADDYAAIYRVLMAKDDLSVFPEC